MIMDYKQLDHDRIINYLKENNGEATVEDLNLRSVANQFRIQSLLIQMALENEIQILEESFWGGPVRVRLSSIQSIS